MILCFYRQEVEGFKEKHKIIDVPYSYFQCINDFFVKLDSFGLIDTILPFYVLCH
jgi:hypothetical protein